MKVFCSRFQGRLGCRRIASLGGFSVLEILFTCAIIAILFTFMFPAMSSMNERARMAICTSNLRQIGMSMVNYAADHDNYFPSADDSPVSSPNSQSWGYRLWPYIGYQQLQFNIDPKNGPLVSDRSIQNNVPLPNQNVFQCPTVRKYIAKSYAPTVASSSSAYKRTYHYSYGMNLRPLQLGLLKLDPKFNLANDLSYPMNRSMIRSWSSTALIMEFDNLSMDPSTFFTQAALMPHFKGTQILFHDCHVEWKNFNEIPGHPKSSPSAVNSTFWTGQ